MGPELIALDVALKAAVRKGQTPTVAKSFDRRGKIISNKRAGPSDYMVALLAAGLLLVTEGCDFRTNHSRCR